MSNEYGWTNDYIKTRTFREIQSAIVSISKRTNRMYKFHASIHGVELNIPTDDSFVDLPLDEEQQKMLEKRKQDAFNRIKARSKKE